MLGTLPRVGILALASFLAFGLAIGWGEHLARAPVSEAPLDAPATAANDETAAVHRETAGDLYWFDVAEMAMSQVLQPAEELPVSAQGGFPTYPLPSGDPEPLGPGVFASGGFAAPLPRSPVWNPAGPKRVGIQIGHWFVGQLPEELRRLSAGASSGGWNEWELNLLIGREVARQLEEAGVEVDLLPATIPIRYRAHAFVAIHADGDTSGRLNGYKLARPGFSSIPDADDELVRTMYREYGTATGMVRDSDAHISRRMVYYYAFNTRRYSHAIDVGTPAVIVETGFLTNGSDRAFLTSRPDMAARGITNGILRFLELELGAQR
jgi:N-acetylmuramoyl-L-alanine amidase